MQLYSYLTIQHPSEGLYKEKGSKFLAFAYPVTNEADIRERLENLRKRYFDARHHCYAYMLGSGSKVFRAFDDGEPNHSAGDPILGQIRSRQLTNILIVVVRYFGGTKLGVGGLISAYKLAADNALNNAVIIQREIKSRFKFEFDYACTPQVMRLIKDFDLEVLDQKFSDDCKMIVDVPARDREHLLEKIDLLRALGTQLDATIADL